MKEDRPAVAPRFRPLIMSTAETGNDMEFNACVGTNTGTSDNSIGYVGGFQKAAEVLLASLRVPKPDTSPQAWAQDPLVDMLVYPICFCARHHIELSIKRMLPGAWRAYLTKFPHNPDELTAPRQLDIRHDIKALWTDLVGICSALDRRFEELCVELDPYIADLSHVDSTGQVFRYDTDVRTSTLHLEDTAHIDIKHFAAGYAQMCRLLDEFENLLVFVVDALDTGTFTSKLTREQLLRIAQDLPDRSKWRQEEFAAAKEAIMREYGLSGTDFNKATKVILSTRWLSFRVGVAIPIPHLESGIFERLHQVDLRRRHAPPTMTEGERSALYGLFEVGSVFVSPEDFESYTVPRPVGIDAGVEFDLAREEDHLARKYANDPLRVEVALRELGQIALLAEFQRVYERELAHLRAERAANGPIKIIWTGEE